MGTDPVPGAPWLWLVDCGAVWLQLPSANISPLAPSGFCLQPSSLPMPQIPLQVLLEALLSPPLPPFVALEKPSFSGSAQLVPYDIGSVSVSSTGLLGEPGPPVYFTMLPGAHVPR